MFCHRCGTDLPDDSHFCRKCGLALIAVPGSDARRALDTMPENGERISSPVSNNPNPGTLVFVGFALLSLIVCFVKGLVPIYFAEAALWAGLAWYWHKKGSSISTATLIVLLCAVAVAAGEGYVISRSSRANQSIDLSAGFVL